MSKQFVQNSYNPGDIVYAKVNPSLKLIIRRYIDQIYYCKIFEFPEKKELVYFEREFVPNAILIEKNKEMREK
ncbi:hypothetical protein [Echinicola salinicaeni]|uniref:hypothetical protein n=1 Tax=Echinicola salinicaeni TaxID=2762757 RepID=UPI001644D66A|nr:hypothetical protein [Echinicola salinicaeni]